MKKYIAIAALVFPLMGMSGLANADPMGPQNGNMEGPAHAMHADGGPHGGHGHHLHGGDHSGPQGGPGYQGGPNGGPQGGYGYDQGPGPDYGWKQGNRMPLHYFQDNGNWVNWQAYGLPQPPVGQHWIHANGAYYLMAVATGIIASIVMHP